MRYLVVIDGVRVRHGRVTAAGKRRRLCRVRPGDEVCDVDRPSTLRRSHRAAAGGLSEDGRHLSSPHGLRQRRGDTQGPRGRVSGVQHGAGRERSSASRAMGDPSPDSDIFEGRVGKGEGSPRVRACAEKERRDRWDGMRFNPGPAGCSRRYFRSARHRREKKALAARLFVARFSPFMAPRCWRAMSGPVYRLTNTAASLQGRLRSMRTPGEVPTLRPRCGCPGR